jgi:hypothetical protein
MLKPQMPNIPGVGVMTDTLDFVKNLWGSMSVPGVNLPGVAAPTLSVDELDKKIADLKAVESWLNMNLSMLRGTIQALEIQRGTIATLKSMGATLAAAVKQPGATEKSVLDAAPYASAFFAQPPTEAPVPEAAAPEAATAEENGAPAAAGLANPGAWWNMLQDQFKQAVSTAMVSDAMAAAGKMSAAAAAAGSKVAAAAKAPAAKKKAPAAKRAPAKPRAAAKPKAPKA